MKYEVLEEQFTLLFKSIETISNAKNLEDKFATEINLMKEKVLQQNDENEGLKEYVRKTTTDRDYYRKNTQSLLTKK